MDNEPMLTATEVATRLRVHVDTVRRYLREGQLKAVRLGRSYRVPQSSLDKFIQEHVTGNGEKKAEGGA